MVENLEKKQSALTPPLAFLPSFDRGRGDHGHFFSPLIDPSSQMDFNFSSLWRRWPENMRMAADDFAGQPAVSYAGPEARD